MECTKALRRATGAASIGLLAVALACSARAAEAQPREIPRDQFGAAHTAFQEAELAKLLPAWDLTKAPAGFDPVIWAAFIPGDNALTPERVELGRKLYFDTRLSSDNTVSCATCHDVTRGFTDQRAVSEGVKNQLGRRNAPTTLNVALLQTLFLDGRSPTLEHQAKLPIVNPIEMGLPNGEAAVNAIKDDDEYRAAFKKAYGRDINYDDMGRAIAAFERTLVFIDSPFRRFLGGDTAAISPEAREGWVLFNEKARCVSCHPMSPGNPLGTDNRFHNIGVSARHQDFEKLAAEAMKALREDPSEEKLDELALSTDMSELGRFMASKQRGDIGAFRTSILLNIGITAPYMHDGTVETLWDVMDHYNKGGEPNLFLDGGVEALALTEEEIDRVVAFLFTLTDVRFDAENAREFARQKAQAEAARPLRDDAAAFRKKLWLEK
ncbi:MAG TPA: cytochrome-c peroxidase [Planctomycetes bacterium]|nr:cytochrome-c peroxidase [Planctomycetota bacterium]